MGKEIFQLIICLYCILTVFADCWDHISPGCTWYDFIASYNHESLDQCKELCSANSGCLSIEIYVDHGGRDKEVKPGECHLHNSDDPVGCNGTDYNTDLYIKKNCTKVDGTWREWNAWSPCSISCGIGMRSQQRKCKPPTGGGNDCPNKDYTQKREICNTTVICPGVFMGTGSCTSICAENNMACNPDMGSLNIAEQVKVNCTNNHTSLTSGYDPSYNESSGLCQGFLLDKQDINCNATVPPPKEEGVVKRICLCDHQSERGFGTWSIWSECSVMCGFGIRKRSRNSSNPRTNHVGVVQEQRCSVCPTPDEWGQWGQYENCTKSCGTDGLRTRFRSCNNTKPGNGNGNGNCPGSNSHTTSCHRTQCRRKSRKKKRIPVRTIRSTVSGLPKTTTTTTLSPENVPYIIKFSFEYPRDNCTRMLMLNDSIFLDFLILVKVADAAEVELNSIRDFNVSCASIDVAFKLVKGKLTVTQGVERFRQKVIAGKLVISIDGNSVSPITSSFNAIRDPKYSQPKVKEVEDDDLSGGAIVGIILAVVVFIIIIIVVVYVCCVKKTSRNQATVEASEPAARSAMELNGRPTQAHMDYP